MTLMGRKDIEDALQRLDNVMIEEARMAGAETLKAIHGVGKNVGNEVHGIHGAVRAVEDRVRDVEGMIQGVGDMLQDVDNRVKGIGEFAIIGKQKCETLHFLFCRYLYRYVSKTNSTSDGGLPGRDGSRKSEDRE
jgi:hypothetical protein